MAAPALQLIQPNEPATDVFAAARKAAEAERRIVRAMFQPPPRMSVCEWSDAFRYLSPEASAEPGKYSSERAPYQREPMEALSDPLVETVILMWPSQVGKTEVANNFIGRQIDHRPGPMLVMQPTLDMAETWSKDRLAPMIRDTPALAKKVREAKSRATDNTILHKKFAGGHLTAVGANSPASLASRPIRDVVCDEVDRYPVSAGAEGDPIGLVFRRQSTFADRKRLLISSPTIKGQSRIEKEYEASDRRKWLVPCPHCNEEQILMWGGRDVAYGLKWDSDPAGNPRPETAHYVCQHCGAVIEEMWKNWMNARGRWRVDNPGHPRRGYWKNALSSPWARWRELVEEWLRIKHDAIRLRQFVNTVLCETWEDEGAQVEPGTLADRCLPYPAEVPSGVALLVRTVDTQGDRLETVVWGFGDGEETWLVEHELIPGDPGTDEPWSALDEIRARIYQHESGAQLRPRVTFIDSGGHHAKEVYAYGRKHAAEKVFACKGSPLEGHPLLGRPTRNNSAKAILYLFGSFTAKESIMSRLKIKAPGPGYVHLPEWFDEEHRQQLTAEKLVTRIVGGRAKRVWIKTRDRNEQLDLFAMAIAALQQLGPAIVRNLGKLAQQIAAQAEQKQAQSTESAAVTARRSAPPKRQSSWVTNWKR